MLVEFVGHSEFLFKCENGKCGAKAVTSDPKKPPVGWVKINMSMSVVGSENKPEGFDGMVCDKCAKKWKRMLDDSHCVKPPKRRKK